MPDAALLLFYLYSQGNYVSLAFQIASERKTVMGRNNSTTSKDTPAASPRRQHEANAIYEQSREAIGYVSLKNATQADYDRIGFMSGLEVHQQLLTRRKLFCRCPAGLYHASDDYDAEIIRHMRPTLSELGEYDGTALMEFRTKKEIIYRIKNETACTYEVDDTPPFTVDHEALDIAIRISLLSKLNIVGEVHITRKQYLDGSIPTGFQRTAIIGVEGEISLKNKKVRLIQLSLEEDSCREISDVGHTRIYKTDRLGMPLIETVTYPDMVNPEEVKEACDVIRFLNRSTGLVRTGSGAGRQDVNVSCKGGTRVEIKGVAHTKWIPALTHIEAFRQWALLHLRSRLRDKIEDIPSWGVSHEYLPYHFFNGTSYAPLKDAKKNKFKIMAINLPGFKGMMAHFTQPGYCFADEIRDRLKVIACLERPNMVCSEDLHEGLEDAHWDHVRELLCSGADDAQIILWGPEADMATALETVEERCKMAFEGVPNETRKSFEDGTTIFERVLPGADRMYPDTDSPPIPLENSHIDNLGQDLPHEVFHRYQQLKSWGIPEDTYTYIFRRNLFPVAQRIIAELEMDPVFTGTFLGHRLKWVEGHYKEQPGFSYDILIALFRFLKTQGLEPELARRMLPVLYQYPKMDFASVLTSLKFKRMSESDLASRIPFLREKFRQIRISDNAEAEARWIMGQLSLLATGNMPLEKLRVAIAENADTNQHS
ncbi:MAG: Glu-tRNA(Gln) amidotransferase subunit GatE [Lentimicrobiaceae bacterium]|nr:Glu-tRNA(Gln) amidotransferase subunit GatE [Lentimicrobiaceae bacterium]